MPLWQHGAQKQHLPSSSQPCSSSSSWMMSSGHHTSVLCHLPNTKPQDQLLYCPKLEKCLNRMIFASITPESPGMDQPHYTTQILVAQEKAVMRKARSKQGRCPSTAGSSQHLPLLLYLRLELNPPCSSPWQRIRTHQFSIPTKHCVSSYTFFLNYLTMKQFKGGF